MNIKDFIGKIASNLHKNNNEQKRIEQGVVAVQNVYDESETKKEANEKAINIVIDTIQTHPNMPVGEFLKMIQMNTDLSDTSLVEIIKQMPEIKSEKATVEAVKKVELATEAITEIIQGTAVSPTTVKKLIEQIPDEEIQREQQAEIERKVKEEQTRKEKAKEEQTLLKLRQIYEICDELNDANLVDEIESLQIDERTRKINEILRNIVAKKIAVDCMRFGGPKLPTMMRIIPATEMLECNMHVLAEEEYYKEKSKFDRDKKKYYPYEAEQMKMVKQKILENIAKDVAKNFEEIGDISIPQIEPLKNLNEEEMNVFVNTVRHPGREIVIGKDDIEMVKRQLKGDTSGEWKNLKRMLEKMKPKDRERAVREFIQVLNVNKNKDESEKKLDEEIAKIGDYIRKIPDENKRMNTVDIIVDVLEQQEKIYENNKQDYVEEK